MWQHKMYYILWFAKFVDILFNKKFVRKLIFTIIFKSFFSSHHQHSKNLQTVRKGIFSMADQNLLDFLPKIKGREVTYCIFVNRLNDKFLKSAKIWQLQSIQGRRKVWKSGGPYFGPDFFKFQTLKKYQVDLINLNRWCRLTGRLS